MSVPTAMGKSPRLPFPSGLWTFGCRSAHARTRTDPGTRRPCTCARRKARARYPDRCTSHLRPVAAWPTGTRGWTGEARIAIESTSCPQTDEDLAWSSLQSLLYFDRIIASVEDEQGSGSLLLLSQKAQKRFHLLGGYLVGVLLRRAKALYVHGSGPALADEVELCDELVGPQPATIGCPAEWRERW